MKNLPKVSIIVPTLNEEKYLENTLLSIKNQDYRGKYEIIVSDGGSKDNTVKIAKRYTTKIIRLEKRGIALGRNRGVASSDSDILIFVDADTVLLPDTLSKLVHPFAKRNVVSTTCSVIPQSSNIADINIFLLYNQFIKASIRIGKPKLTGLCFAVRRDMFEKAGRFDENLATLEDFELAGRLSSLGRIVFVESTFVITSYRRIRKWGRLNSIKKYVSKFVKYVAVGKAFDFNEYKPVR